MIFWLFWLSLGRSRLSKRFSQVILIPRASREAEELLELYPQLSFSSQAVLFVAAVHSTSQRTTMNLLLTPTTWILMLAIAYLVVVYGLLWWAQHWSKSGKRRSIFWSNPRYPSKFSIPARWFCFLAYFMAAPACSCSHIMQQNTEPQCRIIAQPDELCPRAATSLEIK